MEWVRLLRGDLDSLKVLRSRGVDTVVVIGGYHARGIVPLWWWALHLYEMTPDKAPFEGMVMANPLPSGDEIRHQVTQAVGNSQVTWPPSRWLPMLPDEGTKSLVSFFLPFQLG